MGVWVLRRPRGVALFQDQEANHRGYSWLLTSPTPQALLVATMFILGSLSLLCASSYTPQRLSPCIWCFLYIPRVAHPQRGGSLQSPCISCFCRGTRPRTTAHCMPRNVNKCPTQTPFSQWHTLADQLTTRSPKPKKVPSKDLKPPQRPAIRKFPMHSALILRRLLPNPLLRCWV